MEDAIYEADGWGLVWILVGEFDMDFPVATFERGYNGMLVYDFDREVFSWFRYVLTFRRPLESHKELLPIEMRCKSEEEIFWN